MTSIINSNVLPPVISPISVAYGDKIQKAYALSFYYKGCKDVVCIQRSSPIVLTVYIPAVSCVDGSKIVELILGLEKDIAAEEKFLAIQPGNYFLFDTITKKILTMDSFMDYVPYYNTKHSLFIIHNQDGTSDSVVYYLADSTLYGILQFLPIVEAKRNLFLPTKTLEWSKSGVKLLTYLIAKKYGINGTFLSLNGCWDAPSHELNPVSSHRHPVIDKESLIFNKVNDLATTIYGDTDETDLLGESSYTQDTLEETGNVMMLSDLLSAGVESVYGDKYSPVIRVEMDVLRDKYSSITVYTRTSTVYVKLNYGTSMTLEKIKEDLGAENVTIIENNLFGMGEYG